MSKASKSAPAAGPTFEESLQKLERVVTEMESGDLPLETLLARYEEGVKLARACQSKLADAELRIHQLEKSAAGDLSLRPPQLPGED